MRGGGQSPDADLAGRSMLPVSAIYLQSTWLDSIHNLGSLKYSKMKSR